MSQMINVLCQEDNVVVPVSSETIKMIGTIHDFFKMMKDEGVSDNAGENDTFPVEMNSVWFKKIVSFCEYHTNNPGSYEKDENKDKQKDPVFMVDFDKEFINQFMEIKKHHEDILELYRLAHYLNIPQIRNLVAKKLVEIIYNSNKPEDIRAAFGLPPKEQAVATVDASTASTTQN